MGFLLSAVGMVGAVLAAIEALFYGTPPGWGSLMVVLLLVSGVQLIILGIVGEYLGRVLLTASGKPQNVVMSVERSAGAARELSSLGKVA